MDHIYTLISLGIVLKIVYTIISKLTKIIYDLNYIVSSLLILKPKGMEVEIISSETIKPSSFPQSLHLKSFKLSVLDQLSPFTYTSLVFFYTLNNEELSNEDTALHLSQPLKTSLSKALSADFYLLAGTIKHNKQILANGVGALYQVARVQGAMSKVLNQPSFESLSQLLPFRSLQIMSSSTKEASKIINKQEENSLLTEYLSIYDI